MALKKRSKERPKVAEAVQLRSVSSHPFGMLQNYVPLGDGEIRLYRSIREAVPVIDAAILKLIRLIGGFSVRCRDKRVEMELRHFLRTVDTGRGQRGIASFLDAYLDSMITCGRAVGEIVTWGNQGIAALLCGNVSDIQIQEGATPLDFTICARDSSGQFVPLPRQELLLFTPFHPEPENPYGVSLLRSMPFLTEILLKIFHAIGQNWERTGNIRFAVTYQPQGDGFDNAYAHERAEQIAREWSSAMQASKNGAIRDFVAVGDVDIKVIGAENQVLDSAVPVRQILEQFIARTGIPPFMLGLSWSSTERMSAQQADLMTSELTAIRRTLDPLVEKICDLWMRMHGYACPFEIIWDDINLQDSVEEARARLLHAQADATIEQINPPSSGAEAPDLSIMPEHAEAEDFQEKGDKVSEDNKDGTDSECGQ